MIALNFGALSKILPKTAKDAFVDAGTKFFHSDTYDTLNSIKRAIDYGIPESPIKDFTAVERLFGQTENLINNADNVASLAGAVSSAIHHGNMIDVAEGLMVPGLLPTVLSVGSREAQTLLQIGPEAYKQAVKAYVTDTVTGWRDAASAMQKGAFRFAKET